LVHQERRCHEIIRKVERDIETDYIGCTVVVPYFKLVVVSGTGDFLLEGCGLLLRESLQGVCELGRAIAYETATSGISSDKRDEATRDGETVPKQRAGDVDR
jgi:hypothetical protein